MMARGRNRPHGLTRMEDYDDKNVLLQYVIETVPWVRTAAVT